MTDTTISHGVSSGGFTLRNGDNLYVYGTATATVVSSGGSEYAYSGGTVSDTTLSSGGHEYVSSGGNSFSTTISSGGIEIVSSGGVAGYASVSGGGRAYVERGGVAIFTEVSSGGFEFVDAKGLAVAAQVGASGTLEVNSGGAASYTAVSSGGVEIVSGGYTFSTTIFYSGSEIVSSGGVASYATVSGGGTIDVYSGGATSFTAVSNGGTEIVSASGHTFGTTISAEGVEIVSSGGVASYATVSSGGTVDVYSGGATRYAAISNGGVEIVNASAVASGTMVFNSGIEMVSGVGATASDTVIRSGGIADVYSGGIAISTSVDRGVFQIEAGGTASDTHVSAGAFEVVQSGGTGTDTTVNLGGTMDVAYLPYATTETANIDSATDILTIIDGGATYTQQLVGNYSGEYFNLAADSGGGTDATLSTTPCYCPGTLILTEHGEAPVESLEIGDRVVTLSGAKRPIKWIGRRSYAGRFALGRKDILPIRIARGALSETGPKRDLVMSPHHALYLGGVLIEACDLVNGVSITQAERVDWVTYIHIELDSHDILLAEGAPAESFIDDDTRNLFHNAHEYRTLYPDQPREPARYCAPRLKDGHVVEAVRRRIECRAGIATPQDAPLPLRGYVDRADELRVAGWAQNPDFPEAPVCLDLLVDDVLVGQTLAHLHRADLARAGLGSGRHGFLFTLPPGATASPRTLVVRRSLDGKPLPFASGDLERARAMRQAAGPAWA